MFNIVGPSCYCFTLDVASLIVQNVRAYCKYKTIEKGYGKSYSFDREIRGMPMNEFKRGRRYDTRWNVEVLLSTE